MMEEKRFADDVIRDAARSWNVTEEQIMGKARCQRSCAARWSVMFALNDLGWSSVRIGQRLNRDHTTVLYALGRLNK